MVVSQYAYRVYVSALLYAPEKLKHAHSSPISITYPKGAPVPEMTVVNE